MDVFFDFYNTISDGCKSRSLTDKDLMMISKVINMKYTILVGKEFGFATSDLDRILYIHPREVNYRLLYTWRNKNGRVANLKLCVQNLLSCWKRDHESVYLGELMSTIREIMK